MELLLAKFYNDNTTRDAVHEFFIENLKSIAVSKSFEGLDTKGIKEAKEMLDNAFQELEGKYGKSPKPKLTNQAR